MTKLMQPDLLLPSHCNNQINDNPKNNLNEQWPQQLRKEFNRVINCTLLFLLLLFTSCNGLNNTGLVIGNVSGPKTMVSRLPEIIKKPGISELKSAHGGLQDKAGNIWFGSKQGVYRYDGDSFKNFKVMDGLSVVIVSSMMKDNKGNIWIGTIGGACRYDGKTFTSVRIRGNGGANPFLFLGAPYLKNLPINLPPPKSVNNIIQDENGTIWFETRGDIYRFDEKTMSIVLNDGC